MADYGSDAAQATPLADALASINVAADGEGTSWSRLPGPAAALWFLTLILFPFYLFPSGGPQVSDVVMAVLVLLVFLGASVPMPPEVRAVVSAFGWFVGYTALVNIALAIVFQTMRPVEFTLFYVYDVSVFAVVFSLWHRGGDHFLRMTWVGVFVALILQVAMLKLASGGARASGTFNNPNQLGYFALLSGTILSVLARRVRVGALLRMMAYAACMYVAVLSLSKAAMGGIVLLVLIDGGRGRSLALLGLALLAGLLLFAGDMRTVVHDLVVRVGHLQPDDSPAMRGYDRIVLNPQYLVFGAGEGYYHHFKSALAGKEMHSSLGTVLFSYGIPGSIFFSAGLARVFKGAGVRYGMYLVPVLVYGLTHQGLRFSLLWIMMALILATALAERAAGESEIQEHVGAIA